MPVSAPLTAFTKHHAVRKALITKPHMFPTVESQRAAIMTGVPRAAFLLQTRHPRKVPRRRHTHDHPLPSWHAKQRPRAEEPVRIFFSTSLSLSLTTHLVYHLCFHRDPYIAYMHTHTHTRAHAHIHSLSL